MVRSPNLGPNLNPQNTKIFTYQKRISKHLVMNSKNCLLWNDLVSIWKYMPSFFLSIQTLYIKNKSVLLFFCKLFFKSIMFGHNDNFLKRTFVCALSEYKRLIGYFVILKKVFSHKKCFSMRSYFLVFLLTVQF